MNRRAALFFLLYFGAVAYLSLYPFEFRPSARSLMLFWVEAFSRRVFLDTVLNVVFYVPLGAAALVALGRTAPAWLATVLVCFLISLCIEVAQLFTLSRYGNLRDLAANTMGGALGASAAYMFLDPRLARRIAPLLVTTPWKISAPAWLLLSLWMLWQTFPFVPYLSLYGVARSVYRLVRLEWPWNDAGRYLIAFHALAAATGVRSRWLWLAFLAVPGQLFFVNHALSVPAVAGAVAGWLAARAAPAAKLSAAALTGWLVWEEFRPFRFTAEPRAFGWLPMGSLYETADADASIYFMKTFLYTAAVWALRRNGFGWKISLTVPAAILGAGEWAQRYIEGRTPETTDFLLLAAGAVLLKLCERRTG